MTTPYSHILAKSEQMGGTTLIEHLDHVACAAVAFAEYLGLDSNVARIGAVLHDIGKASPVFQERLRPDYRPPIEGALPYRHEIGSLLFLHLVEASIRPQVIDMVVSHHKSMLNDARGRGLLDLDDNRDDVFELHAMHWDDWHDDAIGILAHFGWETRPISYDEAEATFEEVIEYCNAKKKGWSIWKGLLMGADHYASAMIYDTPKHIQRAFKVPNTRFYNRQSDLYPLSLADTSSPRKHTMVTAPTGAGKTDFLIKRCKGRIFYTLPFQASINAMFHRIKEDLKDDNPDLDVRLLHAASRIVVKDDNEEKDLQNLIGASVKVLTPYQVASIVFATKGYESVLADLQDCDVILDEIHTYSDVSKAIVLKIIEVLQHFGCRLHIGTATMPSALYQSILSILGPENVFEYSLSANVLDGFDRHIIHKPADWDTMLPILANAVATHQKILIVCNRVAAAQAMFQSMEERYPEVEKMLIHSRFKRGDRKRLELELTNHFNTTTSACIVISTQVVEVSLDISFDLMVTDAAPLDALIQRFGRINRKRSKATIGQHKPIYVLPPPEDEKAVLPYDLDTVKRSYEQLPDGAVFHEREAQAKIDAVFTDMTHPSIEQSAQFKDGRFRLTELTHTRKSVMLQALDIDSVSCITESDREHYKKANRDHRIQYEIPMRYHSVAHSGLEQLDWGSQPFIVPDKAYDPKIGLLTDFLKPEYYDIKYNFL